MLQQVQQVFARFAFRKKKVECKVLTIEDAHDIVHDSTLSRVSYQKDNTFNGFEESMFLKSEDGVEIISDARISHTGELLEEVIYVSGPRKIYKKSICGSFFAGSVKGATVGTAVLDAREIGPRDKAYLLRIRRRVRGFVPHVS